MRNSRLVPVQILSKSERNFFAQSSVPTKVAGDGASERSLHLLNA
ncbi:MAG: hypothetical protein V7K66_11570 [Nostoc sp.]